MRDFDGATVRPAHQYPAPAKIIYLPKKLFEARAPLVVHKGFMYVPYPIAQFLHSQAKLNVFRKPVKGKTTGVQKNLFADAHIEAPGLKGPRRFLPSPNAPRGENRRHGERHSLLKDSKIPMPPIGAAPCIQWGVAKEILYGLKVSLRYSAIGIEHHQIITTCLLKTKIAARAGARIRLKEISNVEKLRILLKNLFTGDGGAVFNNQHFKIFV